MAQQENGEIIKKYKRPEWDDIFLEIASIIGQRSTCNRGRIGCVLVRDNRIIATGYTGAPCGMEHCDDVGHEFQIVIIKGIGTFQHCVRSIHAEMNILMTAARYGISTENSILYTTVAPCPICARNITNTGIKKVVALNDYKLSDVTKKIFKKAKIEFIIKKGLVEYE